MPYRSPVGEVPANLKRTMLGIFDFRGRSTRTEVFTYMIISQIAANLSAFIVLGLLPDIDFDARQQIEDGTMLLWQLPAFALLARRLHDQDRSGWWALVLLTAIVGAVMSGGGSLSSLRPASLEPPWLASILLLGAIVALWAFSLWPPSEGANRYGPNPRLDEPTAAA